MFLIQRQSKLKKERNHVNQTFATLENFPNMYFLESRPNPVGISEIQFLTLKFPQKIPS